LLPEEGDCGWFVFKHPCFFPPRHGCLSLLIGLILLLLLSFWSVNGSTSVWLVVASEVQYSLVLVVQQCGLGF